MEEYIEGADGALLVVWAKALFSAHLALGLVQDFPKANSRARPKPDFEGPLASFSDLRIRQHYCQLKIDLATKKLNAPAVKEWHERLLDVTQEGFDLPIRTRFDVADLLHDLHSRAKAHWSKPGRRFRVACRKAERHIMTPQEYRSPGPVSLAMELAPLVDVAAELDKEEHAHLHQDFSKVVEWLEKEEGGPIAKAKAARDRRLTSLSKVYLSGQIISREELYEAVWAEPTRTVAARFSISDTMLRKQCRRHAIPTPGRDSWVRNPRVGKPRLKRRRPTLRPLS